MQEKTLISIKFVFVIVTLLFKHRINRNQLVNINISDNS